MTRLGAETVRELCPEMQLVLGGVSPIDPNFIRRLKSYGLLNLLDAVAVYGFPLDWLKDFDITLTLCFTTPTRGKRPCYTSPPMFPEEFAALAAEVTHRYLLPERNKTKKTTSSGVGMNGKGKYQWPSSC